MYGVLTSIEAGVVITAPYWSITSMSFAALHLANEVGLAIILVVRNTAVATAQASESSLMS